MACPCASRSAYNNILSRYLEFPFIVFLANFSLLLRRVSSCRAKLTVVSRSRAWFMKNSSPVAAPAQASSARRRKVTPTSLDPQIPPGTKQINAGPLLETAKPGIDPDAPFTMSKAVGSTAATIHAIFPALISWGVIVALIFGGCCSNVGSPP